MRSYSYALSYSLFLLLVFPVVSAQVQVPPPNYYLSCEGQVVIDVDPETSTPPSKIMDCIITNEESYSLELSIGSGNSGLTIIHDDSIVIQANSEGAFQVTIEAEDRMRVATLMLSMSTEVTKTGQFDYSDDDPKIFNTLITIQQYAAFELVAQQDDNDEELVDDEYFEISYIITNKGNAVDRFVMNTYSYATPVCDEEKTIETSNNDASGCVLMTPISNNCNEELVVKMMGDWSEDWEDKQSMVGELDIDQSLIFRYRLSINIDNSSCWPKDKNDNYHLQFTQVVRAYSKFGISGWYDSTDAWGQYDHSPIWIERTVDATVKENQNSLSSAVPGFNYSYILLSVSLAVIVHNRRIGKENS